ncbi:hypothetical protein Mapa_002478 [Marchantia paleacea]|nr:hypothetical protein Mapa_002478 [Marchantia paleacea]
MFQVLYNASTHFVHGYKGLLRLHNLCMLFALRSMVACLPFFYHVSYLTLSRVHARSRRPHMHLLMLTFNLLRIIL